MTKSRARQTGSKVLVAFLLFLVPLFGRPTPAGAAPEVVATIPPLHSLAAGVMAGTGAPHLLVAGAASPHDYVLRPSDARALAGARLVVWAGPTVETFLARSLTTLAPDAAVLQLLALPGLHLPPGEAEADAHEDGHGHEDEDEEEEHEGHADDDDHDHDHGHAHDDDRDPHAWLDPANARLLTAAIAAALARIDPANADLYRKNATELSARLAALDSDLAARLAPVAGRPFVVFHDAYRHLAGRYGLGPVIPVTAVPSRPLSPRQLIAIREAIRARGVRCLFAEPQFGDRALAAIARDTGATVARLDPLGAALTQGPGLYEALMRANAAALTGCLDG